MRRGAIYLEAQARLRDFIEEHGLRPGDKLPPEAALAAELEISVASLREATRSLQTLGVIEARPGRGLFVAEFSFRPLIEQLPYGLADSTRSFDEVLTAREAMEVGLMPAVIAADAEATVQRCAGLVERMVEAERRGEPIADIDREFHIALYQGLNNPLVDSLIELFWRMFGELFPAADASAPDRASSDEGAAHRRIVDALAAGDASQAMQSMRDHFERIRLRVQRMTGTSSPRP